MLILSSYLVGIRKERVHLRIHFIKLIAYHRVHRVSDIGRDFIDRLL